MIRDKIDASKFEVLSGGSLHVNDYESVLQEKCLYKSLSLCVAAKFEVPILPTRLLLSCMKGELDSLVSSWNLPIVVRLDYQALPQKKPRGGINCISAEGLAMTCQNLLDEGLYPILHPNVDRFRNKYSVGVVLDKRSGDVLIEGVGEGFDAGDLRLGASIPHETILCSLLSDEVMSRKVIQPELYSKERISRLDRVAALQVYQNLVERDSRLGKVPALTNLGEKRRGANAEKVPDFFRPMSRATYRELTGFLFKLWSDVLPILPHSEKYVASFSLLPNHGWILWDVYGKWYLR